MENIHIRNIKIYATSTSISAFHMYSPGFIDVEQVKGAEILSSHEIYLFIIGFHPSRVADGVFYTRESGASMVLTSAHLEIDSKSVRSNAFKYLFSASANQQETLLTSLKIQN